LTAISQAAEPARAPIAPDRENDPTSRVGRYVARLDEFLLTKTPSGQKRLLARDLEWWTSLYEHFVKTINQRELDPSPNGPDVNDYLLVIAAIELRLGRLAP
jgi:hypothetical protein